MLNSDVYWTTCEMDVTCGLLCWITMILACMLVGLKSLVISLDYQSYMGSSVRIWSFWWLFLYLCFYNLDGSVTQRAKLATGRIRWRVIGCTSVSGQHFEFHCSRMLLTSLGPDADALCPIARTWLIGARYNFSCGLDWPDATLASDQQKWPFHFHEFAESCQACHAISTAQTPPLSHMC
jgi:hypothetical protein